MYDLDDIRFDHQFTQTMGRLMGGVLAHLIAGDAECSRALLLKLTQEALSEMMRKRSGFGVEFRTDCPEATFQQVMMVNFIDRYEPREPYTHEPLDPNDR